MNELDYEQAVNSPYEGLYRFAFSLAGNADDASELTQESFARLLAKGGQLRDHSKVKGWLFTTLYRIYLGWKRRETNLPHFEIASVESEIAAAGNGGHGGQAAERSSAERIFAGG